MAAQQPLLQIEDLRVVFPTPLGVSHALRGVDLAVEPGEIFGVVGESGCGKSMTARAIMGLIPHPGRVAGGRIHFDGQDLVQLSGRAMRRIRGRRIGMIFQNPKQALNPVFTVGEQLALVLKHHGIARNGAEVRERSMALLGEVGLPQTERVLNAYPHQLSGGQQQRAMIAIALATEPELLIADEPTTALDVTIQAQILELLDRLQRERGLTILLITHDMGVVATMCDRVAVLYAGRVVEQGQVGDIFKRPGHPYTQGLLAALPTPQRRGQELETIPGSVPGGLAVIPGCAFASRCPQVMDVCRSQVPSMVPLSGSHRAACFLHAPTGTPQEGEGAT